MDSLCIQLESLEEKIDIWQLNNDHEVIYLIKESYKYFINKIASYQNKINDLSINIEESFIEINSLNTSLSILSSHQYIEINIDEYQLAASNIISDIENKIDPEYNFKQHSINIGLNFFNKNFQKIDILPNNNTNENEINNLIPLKNEAAIQTIDPYIDFKLPLLFQEQKFIEYDHCGLSHLYLSNLNNIGHSDEGFLIEYVKVDNPGDITRNNNVEIIQDLPKNIMEPPPFNSSLNSYKITKNTQDETKNTLGARNNLQENKFAVMFNSSTDEDDFFKPPIPKNSINDSNFEKPVEPDDIQSSIKKELEKRLGKIKNPNKIISNVQSNFINTLNSSIVPTKTTIEDSTRPDLLAFEKEKHDDEIINKNTYNIPTSSVLQQLDKNAKNPSFFSFDDDDDIDLFFLKKPDKTEIIVNSSSSSTNNKAVQSINESDYPTKISSMFDDDDNDDDDNDTNISNEPISIFNQLKSVFKDKKTEDRKINEFYDKPQKPNKIFQKISIEDEKNESELSFNKTNNNKTIASKVINSNVFSFLNDDDDEDDLDFFIKNKNVFTKSSSIKSNQPVPQKQDQTDVLKVLLKNPSFSEYDSNNINVTNVDKGQPFQQDPNDEMVDETMNSNYIDSSNNKISILTQESLEFQMNKDQIKDEDKPDSTFDDKSSPIPKPRKKRLGLKNTLDFGKKVYVMNIVNESTYQNTSDYNVDVSLNKQNLENEILENHTDNLHPNDILTEYSSNTTETMNESYLISLKKDRLVFNDNNPVEIQSKEINKKGGEKNSKKTNSDHLKPTYKNELFKTLFDQVNEDDDDDDFLSKIMTAKKA